MILGLEYHLEDLKEYYHKKIEQLTGEVELDKQLIENKEKAIALARAELLRLDEIRRVLDEY